MDTKDKSLPRLMRDSSETDGKAEIVMDYVLSWTLRRAAKECDIDNKPLLRHYCRYMLGLLLEIPMSDDVIVSEVKVWKEYWNIDLWVEVALQCNGETEHHAILIENKYYTMLHNSYDDDGVSRNQLEVYRKKFDRHYADQEHDNDIWQKHYALITCIDRDDPKFESYKIAESFGFNIFSFYDLLPEATEDTESDIFNEFWLRSW